MGLTTAIGWTDKTWNISRGCSKVDEDCRYCYMYRDSMVNTRYDPKTVVKTKTVFDLPLHVKIPSKIFTCSLTDFLHEGNDPFRVDAFDIMLRCPQHVFQVLSKRIERLIFCLRLAYEQAVERGMDELSKWLSDWIAGIAPDNVWLGTSVGSPKGRHRIIELLDAPATVRFLSIEPYYEEIDLENIRLGDGSGVSYRTNALMGRTYEWDSFGTNGIYDHGYSDGNQLDWIIIGGESGNDHGSYRYRPCKVEWLQKVVEKCKYYDIPVFVKQLGTQLAKELKLKNRHGADPTKWPLELNLNYQQFPLL